MFRKLLISTIALLLSVGVGLSDDGQAKGKGKNKGKAGRAIGVVKTFDADTGMLTLTIRDKQDKSGKDEEFTISKKTKVTTLGPSQADTKDGTGPEALKDVKPGTRVTVMHADGKVTAVLLTPMGKRKKNDK